VIAVVVVNETLKRWYNRRTQRAAALAVGTIELGTAA
jgi:hypothetical protein